MTVKAQRQRLLADWLRGGTVKSQDELVAKLRLAGLVATQATVSRDLDELGAVKLRRDGTIRYALPESIDPGHAAAKLDRLLAEWVTLIIPAGDLLVLRTPPGSASLVANALDSASLDGIAGTLAGDDTIFVALAEGCNAGAIGAQLAERRARG
jgi:transcriptional regulator of arginine metabolism